MKVVPGQVAASNLPQTQPTPSQVAAKARVVAMLTQQPKTVAPDASVADPNQVSVEELSAIRTQPSEIIDNNSSEEEAVTLEPSEETKSPPVTEDPKLANKFAQLAKRERQMRHRQMQQEQAFKAREQALAAREAQLSAKDQDYTQNYIPKDRLKQQTLDVLAETGISYDELTNQILNQPNRDPRVEAIVNELRNEIKSLKQANEESKKSQETQQQDQYKQAVNQIRSEVKQLVLKDPEFETIKSTNSINDVVELIERTYKKDNVLLSVEDAAREVEDYLIEEAMNLTKIQKIQKRIQANAMASKSQQNVAQTPQPQKQQQTQPGIKTLTNSISSARKMSARDRAIAAMEGKLK